MISISGGSRGGHRGHGPPQTVYQKKIFFLHYFFFFSTINLHYFLKTTFESSPRNLEPRTSKSGRKTPSTINYPPSNEYLIDDYPPSKSGPENSINYPPSNSQPERKFAPPPNSIPRSATDQYLIKFTTHSFTYMHEFCLVLCLDEFYQTLHEGTT